MHFDRLDEMYTMVKSILHCEQIHQTGLTGLRKRSDRFPQLCQFWSSMYAPYFFLVKLVCQKTISWTKIFQGRWLIIHWPFIYAKSVKQLSAMTCYIQVDIETTCFGRHTFFVIADFIGMTTSCCSIAFFLRKYCSLRFWVWDKSEGHHFGCKYFESCFSLFSSALLQSTSSLTRLLQVTIGLWGEP